MVEPNEEGCVCWTEDFFSWKTQHLAKSLASRWSCDTQRWTEANNTAWKSPQPPDQDTNNTNTQQKRPCHRQHKLGHTKANIKCPHLSYLAFWPREKAHRRNSNIFADKRFRFRHKKSLSEIAHSLLPAGPSCERVHTSVFCLPVSQTNPARGDSSRPFGLFLSASSSHFLQSFLQ